MWHLYIGGLPWRGYLSLFLLLFLLTREVHAVSVLFPVSSVFDTQSIPRLSPHSAKRRHSRLGWLWVCLSDEKDEETVMENEKVDKKIE